MVIGCVALTACDEPTADSLCPAFEQYLDARTTIQAVDFTTQSAAQAIAIAETYLASVDRLQTAAVDRYGVKLQALETAVNDILLTLSSVQDDADYATWQPLVQDDFETAQEAAGAVIDAIEPSCTPDTSGT
jgi:hypothetical protein